MSDRKPLTIEVAASYRVQLDGSICCSLTATGTTLRGQLRILESAHLTGRDPEALIDQAEKLARDWTFEHFLYSVEPF